MIKIILIICLLSSTAVSVPPRQERAGIATVQTVVERISRVLQAFRRTLQTSPSQQQLGRMPVRLRQLSTNLGRARDYLDPQQFNQARDALNALQHSIDNSGTGNNSGFNTTSTTAPLMSRPLVNRPSPGRGRGRPARAIDRERSEQLRILGFSISYTAREGLLGGTVHHNTLRLASPIGKSPLLFSPLAFLTVK